MSLKLLVCIIHKKKLLDQILARLIELDVGGATVIDTTGVGRSKVEDVLLYEGFKDVLRGTQKDHFTVLCVVKEKQVDTIAKALTQLYGDFTEKGIGFFLTVPVEQIWGIHFADKQL